MADTLLVFFPDLKLVEEAPFQVNGLELQSPPVNEHQAEMVIAAYAGGEPGAGWSTVFERAARPAGLDVDYAFLLIDLASFDRPGAFVIVNVAEKNDAEGRCDVFPPFAFSPCAPFYQGEDASESAFIDTPISSSVRPMAVTRCSRSCVKTCPIVPIRKQSAWVSLPG